MTTFWVYLLHEHQHASYRCLESYQVEASDEGLVKHLEQTALEHIKSRWKFRQMGLLGAARLEIYQCSRPLQGRSSEEKRIQAIGIAGRGDLQSESFFLLSGDNSSKGKGSSDLIIVFRNLRFDFVVFENTSRSSFNIFCHGNVIASPEDSGQMIYDAARHITTRSLRDEDPWTVATIDWFCLREVKVQYETDYRKALEGELAPSLVGRGRSSTRNAEDKISDFETSNLIVLFTATREPRKRLLRIPYVLFNRDSWPYLFVGQDHVDASSEDTVGLIHDVVRQHIEAIPAYMGWTGYRINVYEPQEAFQSAYNKQPNEVKILTLEDETFFGDNCLVLLPRKKLSDWREGQTLIVVFGISAQPQPPTAPISIVDRLRNMHIAGHSPSYIAKIENYKKLQEKPETRILDDRPNRDKLIAPTPLLFQPFGYFHDIRCGVEVPGQEKIRDGNLRQKVNKLAEEMTQFHDLEEDRRPKFLAGLEDIFDLTPGTINPSEIAGTKYRSDGHLNGDHGVMVFCVECKNEISTASCEPAVQLVAYISQSFKSRGNQHPELFKRWKVPVLGAMNVGPNVQFFGIVWVGRTVRVTPLTPLLSMVDPAGEGSRWDLFLAFKAARIVFAEIRTHIQDILGVLDGLGTDWPPSLALEEFLFPSITEIETYPPTDTDTQPETIKFILEARHDDVEHRELYHARLVSPTSPDKAIYVKFSQRYSVELHGFCAEQHLAPRILGFQRLHGGWFAVAMEKIDTVDDRRITSFPEAVEWKSKIEELVHGFHQKGLVHGDLRLANFVFTSDKPRRMILVDFDWGGKDGEVEFPHEELIEDLGVSNSKLYGRKITKEHDQKCLEKVKLWLDGRISAG